MIYIRTEAALSFIHPKSLKNFTYFFSYSNALSQKCTSENLFEARKRVHLLSKDFYTARKRQKNLNRGARRALSAKNASKVRSLLETEDC